MISKKRVLYFASFSHTITHAMTLTLAPLLPLIRSDLNLTNTETASFAFISFLMYGALALPSGLISDRVGSLKVIKIGLVLFLLSIIGIFISSGPLTLWLSLLVLGISAGAYHPAGLSLVSRLYPKDMGKAMGFNGLLGNLGEASSPIIAAAFGVYIGWKYPYLFWSVPILILLSFSFSIKDSKIIDHVKDEESHNFKYIEETKKLLSKDFLLYILILLFRGLFYTGTVLLLTTFAKDVLSIKVLIGGLITTILIVSGMPGQLIGGKISDKLGYKKPLLIFTFVSSISIAVIANTSSAILFVLFSIIMGFSYFAAQPAQNMLTASMGSPKIRGLLYGFSSLCIFGFGSFAVSVGGYIADILTWRDAFYILALFALIDVFLIYLKSEKKK
ncbi:MAG: multidrug resistance protein D [Candidatus Methanofastidiosum methylothiophilum]|uniref:Multidrug resistance protein D n=1 Tax=Candidatus Methanofastidiosum methylothiophilum TaxID=1705564 RepID=A0A150IJ20_9EURY|nr:MAG: multidrug resistance protein D [Candidatus Methanofastidiosum methylthiophilus]KYC47805.1 MAG: multidrug resistance protein D [Candidatus Methanofastidiosum methylthiophilus]KYC49827.1 MAG: multidrug resistance protein D [Candidatus Methanofastidiosum methylthiophilus]